MDEGYSRATKTCKELLTILN